MNTLPAVRFVNTICFHGLNMAVLNADGIDYIPAKPLCELAGLDWKGAKRTLQSPDKVYLYGLKRLIPPPVEGLGGLKSPQEGVLCLRLERSRMYLAQISTERMRANGNHEGADQVLALQLEWAKALHAYETHGMAVKAGRNSALEELLRMTKLRNQLNDPKDRRYVDQLIHEGLHTLGAPANTLDNDQQHSALPLPISLV